MLKFKSIIALPMIILITTLFLGGCSGYTSMMSREIQIGNSWEMSYASFSGTKSIPIRLEKGKPIYLTIDMTTKEGKLEVSFLDNKDKVLYKVDTPKEQVNKLIEIHKDGTYQIQVKGEHKGGFKINWAVY
jgi:hypothetical protein